MAAQEAVLDGGVGVVLAVRVRVVMPVMRRPPQRPALHGRGAQQREHELRGARGAEGAMGKVPVIERRDREHADQEQRGRDGDRRGTRSGREGAEAGDMYRHERQHARPVDAVFRFVAGDGRVRPAVDPAAQREREAARRHGARLPALRHALQFRHVIALVGDEGGQREVVGLGRSAGAGP